MSVAALGRCEVGGAGAMPRALMMVYGTMALAPDPIQARRTDRRERSTQFRA